MRYWILLIIIAIWNSFPGSAQDTVRVMNYDQFLQIVLEHHPVVYQADNAMQSGEAQLLQSRGGFDPKLNGSAQQKQFDDKDYYELLNAGLKIPTWFGVTAETGIERNSGVYLNPQFRTPDAGLWYAGLRIELGNGLLIDQRRAELKKGKLAREAGVLERKMMRNQLIYDASLAYWNWLESYQVSNVYKEAVRNAELRLDAVKGDVEFGERPVIDTVEAGIQLMNRQVKWNEAQLKFRNATELLELYLWKNGVVPLEIDGVVPEEQPDFQSWGRDGLIAQDSLVDNHPYLELNRLKTTELEVDLRLKKEQLKPKVTLKYNFLNEPVGANVFAAYSTENYSWGGTIAYPILTRKERGGVQLAELKLENQQLELNQNRAKIEYKLNTTRNKLETTTQQLQLQSNVVQSYTDLLIAEQRLFNMGESSLFMINSREKALLESRIQLIATGIELQKLQAEWELNSMQWD